MNILFICKYNAFRSRISEEYFKKINKNKKIKVTSRGLIMGEKPGPNHSKVAKEILGVDILNRKPLPLNVKDIHNADLIIITADDIPRIIFNHKAILESKKPIFWEIKDEHSENERNIKRIVLNIKDKIDSLNNQLLKKNGYRNS